MTAPESGVPVLEFDDASLTLGGRTLWEGLSLSVAPGEMLAVLGSNGSGKTSLLKAILGLLPLSGGQIRVSGEPVSRGNRRIGYIPQQRLFPPETPLRGRDLVGLGLDGHRYGMGIRRRNRAEHIDTLLAEVGAEEFGRSPVGLLSGGEQQRLRAAQALASDPSLLLCDEPLLSLDLNHQQQMSSLIARQTERGTGVVFVTHEINPVIEHVDRVLYLAGGRFSVGTPEEVLRTDVLSDLYGARVDVVRVGGRVIVVGGQTSPHHIHVAGQSPQEPQP